MMSSASSQLVNRRRPRHRVRMVPVVRPRARREVEPPQNGVAVQAGQVGRLAALSEPVGKVGDALAVEHQCAVGYAFDPQRTVEADAQRFEIFGHVLR